MKKVAAKYRIKADYAKWRGDWVHYTTEPYLKVHPKQFHNDPTGLYFFPESFKNEGQWHYKPYKFVAQVVDGMKVLDLSDIQTLEDAQALYKKLGLKPGGEFEAYHAGKTGGALANLMWADFRSIFLGKPASFNGVLRRAGFDAVFDDTGSVHSSEVQLIVLDPKKVKDYKRIDRKGTGHSLVKDTLDKLAAALKEYGKPAAVKIERNKNQDGQGVTTGKMTIYPPDYEEAHYGPAVHWEVSVQPGPAQKKSPDEIIMRTSWTGDSRGFYTRSDIRDFNFEKTIPDLKEAMERLLAEKRKKLIEYKAYLKKKESEPA